MTKKVKRLYESFQPEHYIIELQPDRDKMTFSGTVTITGQKVGRPSKRLTFHQVDLNISAATIDFQDKKGSRKVKVDRINHHKNYDEVRLHSSENLLPGKYSISLKFSGTIKRAMQGIYPCFFKYKGKQKMLIATQFESHHAREAFPCVDEPEAKATFDLVMTTPAGETVLSNTPVKSQKTVNGNYVTSFETTPIMSTYLLAFVYGPMHSVSGKSKNGIKVNTWSTVAQPQAHLEYANNEAIALLDLFEDYFGVDFPLKKLDQVALPDFESLAMENWGLITFREVGLLADPKNRSISGERLITMVIAHELSHQWFGNLVTMRWWDDLWLNESFASVMETLGPDKLHPDWQEWEDFTSTRVIGASNRDVYKDVQPVGVTVNHPDEILTLFDPMIVYAKGARVLKMLFDFIGEEAFRKGLKSYFKTHAYKNTERADLWRALGQAAGMDVEKLMNPWIEQSGAPELLVRKANDGLELSQQRFLLDAKTDSSHWPIPLLVDLPINIKILDKTSVKIKTNSDQMPIFNPNGSGHYIVRYEDKEMWRKLSEKIIDRSLNSSGRIISINDMLLQAQKGQLNLVDILSLIKKCSDEDRDPVWSLIMRTMGYAQLLTDDSEEAEELMKKFKGWMANKWYQKLGWEDKPTDEPNTKQLRVTALSLSVASEKQDVIDLALSKMAKAKTVEALPAEQRAIIAGAAVRFGDKKYIKQFMQEYQESNNPDVQSAITAALCSTRDPKVAKQIVDWGMNDDNVIRPQDIDHWFAYLMRNRYTRAIAWDWFVKRWPHLVKQFGGGKKMEYFIWYSSRSITSPEWYKKYRKFFESKLKEPSLKRNIAISFAEIEARLDWRKRENQSIIDWLITEFK